MRLLFVLVLLCTGGIANATNYYFSSVSGDDSRTASQAQNSATPWKSLSKLNSFFSSLNAGDSILFKRGETFYGSIVVNKSGTLTSPIKLGAYGSGAKPIISGFTPVAVWTSLSGNIWESTSAVTTLATCNLISLNGVNTAYGRMPKTGFWTAPATTATSITDATNLNASVTDWTGANLVARTVRWHLDRATITSVSGNTINFSGLDYALSAGWGYFIQNHPSCLTQQNDWCYIASTKKIRIYSTTQPVNIKVPTVDEAVTINAFDYLTFDNLNFQGYNSNGINTNSRTGITIQNCDFSFIADIAVQTVGSGNALVVKGCTFTEINSGGVHTKNSTNSLIQNNIFTNVGNIAGMGGNGDLSYTAIYTYGDNTQVLDNSITRSGYVGIRWDGNAVLIKGNFVNYTNYLKDDGGGIYCYPNNGTATLNHYTQRTVRDNISINALGTVAGGEPAGVAQGYCIFNDGSSPNINYVHNTMSNGRFGLFMQGGYDCLIDSNTIYGATQIGIYFTNSTSNPVTNNTITNNISVTNVSNAGVGCGSGKYAMDVYGISSLPSTWTASNNIYANPLDQSNGWIYSVIGTGSTCKTVADWQSQTGKDAGSTGSPLVVSDISKIRFEYNETSVPKTISLGATYIDLRSVSYPATITLAPYSSAVLLKTGTGNVLPTANAGPDQAIILPTSAVNLFGTGTDPDGTISSYAWTKISGPASGAITSATAASTTVTGMVQGTYKFELKVTDNSGGIGRDTMQVTVSTSTNLPPTATAGLDQNIILPTNSISLAGSGTDADGTIVSYAWTKISGPASGAITNATSASTTVTGLVQGIYKFELRVTDNGGATAADTMQLTVNAGATNQAPTADAGTTVWLNLPANSTAISGTGTDPDGTIVSYLWAKVSGPAAGSITNATLASTTVTGLVQGVYKWELTVTDNLGATGKDTVLTIVNAPPTANAGTDQTITLPANSVTLTGTGIDTDGTIASYTWTKISGPLGFSISNATSATTTVTGLVQGVYLFELTVTDNSSAADKDTIQVTVNAATVANTPYGGTAWPIPGTIQAEDFDNGGQNIAYYDLTTANLGGAYRPNESVDLKNTTEAVAYVGWTDPGEWMKYTVNVLSTGVYTLQARVASLNNVSSFRVEMDGVTLATFTAPNTGGYETWQTISVANINLTAGIKVMRIYCITGGFNINFVTFVSPTNLSPTANAGLDQNITLPTNSVSLAGTGTDADGTIASYAWTKVSGPASGTITSATSASTTVTGMVQGTYKFELKVTDNSGAIGRDTMQVSVNAANIAPTANAGLDQNITLPTNSVSLAGTGTDADGTIASYAWTKVSGPASGTITSATAASTTVTGMVQGTYKFELKVTDNSGAIGRDTMQVSVNTANIAPTANAGLDQNITLPTNSVSLAGTGTDADGTIASYAWTKVSGPASGTITSATAASTTVTGMVQGTYKFELKVTDNSGAIGRDTMQVSVNTANIAPTANAGLDQNITLPTNSVSLAGTGTDADGTIASYAWTKLSGPASGTITSATAASTTVTGMVQGTYKFELKVTDNSGAIGRDTMQVNVNAANIAPTANAGLDQNITLPTNSVSLAGTGTDADGTIASYAWTKVSGPASGTITSATAASTTVTGMVQGTYKFELKVTDNSGAIGRDTMQVNVNAANIAPTANAGLDQNITLPTNSVSLAGTGTDANGTIASYLWTKISGPATFSITTSIAATTTVTSLVQGVYLFELKVTDNAGAIGKDTVQVNVNGVTNTPYTGTPQNIPGTIEIEDYDNGGQNLAYYDATTGNAGGAYRPSESVDLQMATEGTAFLGWTNDNEWTKYTVNVTSTGTYTLVARVSTFSTIAACRVEMDGVTIANISVPYTAGYQTWQDVSIPNISLTAGIKVMRFYVVVGGFNITRLIFTQTGTGRNSSLVTAGVNQNLAVLLAQPVPVSIYPNPFAESVKVQLNNTSSGKYLLSLIDIFGNKVWEKTVNNPQGSITEMIDTRNLLHGVYLLEVISPDHKRTSYKVIKN